MAEKLEAQEDAVTVRAGGIAPVGSCPKDKGSGPVAARAYAHPALPGRVVVRLEADPVAAAADAEMDALGFGEASASASLGIMRHRTIGFPGWALLHDPKHARFALEVTREFKAGAKRAKSKPGHAKEAFDAIAARLAKSVPHFLPSFWEEVARVFLKEEALAYAAQAFERARQAEKEFALEVDEEARAAAFLEFALAGALSAKSLAAYAHELSGTGAAEAYERFRELALGRTRGGLPPWAGMGRELRGLAKAAKKDVAAEEERFFAEVAAAPSLARAPADFWKHYRDAAVGVGKRDAGVRRRLTELFPSAGATWRGVAPEHAEAHFEILEACGALAALADPKTPAEQLPAAGLAAWIGKAVNYLGTNDRSRALLTALAPRLKEAGAPVSVTVYANWRRKLSLDLAEIALENGVAVELPQGQPADFSLEGVTVDPVRVAADPVLAPTLVTSVGMAFGNPAFEAAARGKRGLLAARRAWLEGRIAQLEGGLLADAEAALIEVNARTSPATYADIDGTLERLQAASWPAVLARTLRAGLLEELSWPEYEEAHRELGAGAVNDGAFPHLVVRSAARAVVLGPGGRVAEHDLAYDARTETITKVLWIDGALLVTLRPTRSYEGIGYWSTDPKRRFAVKVHLYGWIADAPTVTALPGGGATLGHAAIRAGDTVFEGFRPHFSDGQCVWVYAFEGGKSVLRELDTATGKPGRASRPTFLEGFASAGQPYARTPGWVTPAPPGLAGSPLGMKDGLLGMCARLSGGQLEVRMIDGATGALPLGALPRVAVRGVVRWPGVAAGYVLGRVSGTARGGAGMVSGPALFASGGACVAQGLAESWSGAGWPCPLPPVEFWHYLEVREPAATEALRRAGEAAAAELVTTAAGERTDEHVREKKLAATMERVKALLPGVTAAPLVRAVAVAAARVAQLSARRDAIAARTAEPRESVATAPATGPAGAVQRMFAALADPALPFDMPAGDWMEWITRPRGRALLLDSPLTSAAARAEELALVEALLASPLTKEPGHYRYLRCGKPGLATAGIHVPSQGRTRLVSAGGSTYAMLADWRITEVLERNTSGTFVPPKDLSALAEVRYNAASFTWLARWLEAARAGPCLAWTPDLVPHLAEATGLSRAEAALLWVGAPGLGSHHKDFLGAEARAVLNLKMAEADSARGSFKALPRGDLLELLSAAPPDAPVAGASPVAPDAAGTSPVERLGAAWKAKFGARAAVPEDLLLACDKELGPPVPAAELLRTFQAPDASPLLARAGGPDHPVITAGALLLPWLALHLPAGDPLAAAAPAFHAKLVAALEDPALVYPLGTRYFEKGVADAEAFLDALGGQPTKLGPGALARVTRAVDGGLLLAGAQGLAVHVWFRAAAVCADALAVLKPLTASMFSQAGPVLPAILFLRSEACRALVERLAAPAIAAGAFDANPAASAPALVERAAKALEVGAAAAAYYLQLLALPEPTSRAVQRWNGWDTKQLKRAAAELVAKKLVIEAKRERSGRDAFLPGEWVKGAGKDLPFEGWKRALHEGPAGALARRLPLEPLPALFERAWKRVESGDAPKFEEVR